VSPPIRVTIVAAIGGAPVTAPASAWPALLSGVGLRARSMMGSGKLGRPSSLRVLVRAPYRDRDGLTFPTSSAEQIATPGRSLRSFRGWWLPEPEVCLLDPHAMHDNGELPRNSHARLFPADAFGELMPHALSVDHFLEICRCEFAAS